MKSNIWTEKAVKNATKIPEVTEEILTSLTEQLTDLVYFSPNEKIAFFAHVDNAYVTEGIFGRGFKNGDFVVTSSRLLYGEHPITKTKTGLFSSQKTVHHDRYVRPIGVKVNLDSMKKVYVAHVGGEVGLRVVYGNNFATFYHDEGACVNAKVELEKAIDAYKDRERKPKPLEVVHKGSIVNVNVDSKGYLLNVEPCPTCGSNLSLSPDRKTAYCKYCKKEIPTVEQLKE